MTTTSTIVLLEPIIRNLQEKINCKKFTTKVVEDAISELSKICNGKYKYKYNLFPELKEDHDWGCSSLKTPENLAEALLWKMGSWDKYQNFAKYYLSESFTNKGTDVVNFAFAKHLRNKNLPIFDQHALRALWAITEAMNSQNGHMCKSTLFDSNNKWRTNASGSNYNNCYDIFVKQVNLLTGDVKMPTKGHLDKLLMPLGKAIKDNTVYYVDFHKLCNWGAS